ncbi:MAG: hypothetical protein U5L45_18900 [Saprospiraceae bacterium]|nr:hypothetical protein [Saprospiraceae bacterium]
MRAFLFFLLAAVAAIMLWAIRSESYQNGLVFALSSLAAGLCGYLLADYFFNIEKKTLKEDIASAGKDIQALKDEKDLLQTQFNLATPHAQVEQLEQQVSFADEQRHKLDGLARAQYAEIAGLKTQLEMQKKNYQKLYEEAAIASETHSAEITNLQDTLASKRQKIKYLTDEGEYLRNKIKGFEVASEEATIQKVVSEVNVPPAPNLPKMVVKIPQNGNGNGAERGLLQMFDPRSIKSKSDTVEAEAIVETSTIESPTVMELKPIELRPALEKKTIDLQIVEKTEVNTTNNVVEAATTVDDTPSVSEKKLSLAEIIAEVQAAELQDNNLIESKINTIEAQNSESQDNNLTEPEVKVEPITVSIIDELVPTIVEDKIEVLSTTIVEKLAEPAAVIVENQVENKTDSEPLATSNGEESTSVNEEKTIIEAPVFSLSKKITPKTANTPVVSMSKSIVVPTASTQQEAPTVTVKTEPMFIAVAPEKEPDSIIETLSMPTDATNLQAIQGIDAEIERVLKSVGIDTWEDVSEATPQRLVEILKEGKIRGVDVSHWSVQAVLLADGHVNRLKTFLENLRK